MRIQFVKEKSVKLSGLSMKTYPAGWTGEVADEVAIEAILEDVAIDPSGEVTKEIVQAEIERRQAVIEAGGDPDAPPIAEEVDLSKMKFEDLREYATGLGLDPGRLKKAELIAAIEAFLAEPAAQTDAAG